MIVHQFLLCPSSRQNFYHISLNILNSSHCLKEENFSDYKPIDYIYMSLTFLT